MASVEDQLAELQQLSLAELRTRWRQLTGTPAPLVSHKLLQLALAWELQAKVHGGLSRLSQQKLAQLADGKTRTRNTSPGMRLVREWNGVAHVVTVADDQRILWDGRSWNSLSEVARAITGTRWSGPAFFGLKKRVAA